jgi:homoserine kinase type II
MAVYTQLGAETLADIVAAYDVGTLVSAKGIAEGVSNSNWLIETTGSEGVEGFGAGPGGSARFILTVYEQRTEVADLPFFLGLLDHLAARNCPVPRTIHDRDGAAYRMLGDAQDAKALALIEFLPGVSVSTPTPAQAHAVGGALAQLHLAGQDFPTQRANSMGPAAWRALADGCGQNGLESIEPGLSSLVADALTRLAAVWPADLPRSVVHADLFPDNVLMIGDRVEAMIDFYFACTDIIAYDLAITHAAWCFSPDGRRLTPERSRALLAGYEAVRAITPAERTALPVLAQGAAMRFLMSRAYDWANTPDDALVNRHDPLPFARRLEFYADPANAGVFEQSR